MLTLRRTCCNRIITRALGAEGEPLLALLRAGAEDCEICVNAEQLRARLESEPAAITVYNPQADAAAPVEGLDVSPAQLFIEIRQDTRGVLGLQAYRQQGREAGIVLRETFAGQLPLAEGMRKRCLKCY